MRVKAVVSEQSSEVDDVVHVFVVVRFVRDENPPWIGTKSVIDAGRWINDVRVNSYSAPAAAACCTGGCSADLCRSTKVTFRLRKLRREPRSSNTIRYSHLGASWCRNSAVTWI